jgi:cytochrome c peroxidase
MSMTINTSHLMYENSNYATMHFEPESLYEANNSLHIARGLMEQVKKEFEWISYGDFWTLASVAAI